MTKLSALVDMTFGFAFKSADFTADPSDVRLLRGDNVAQGRLRWDGVKRFPALWLAEFDNYLVSPGDVVIAMDRPWIEAGLKYSVVRESDTPALLVQRVARLRARQGLSQGYLGALIGSKAFTDYILGTQTGSAVPHISGKQIGDFSVPNLPSLPEQAAIAAILESIDDKIASDQRAGVIIDELLAQKFKRLIAETAVEYRPLAEVVAVTKGVSYKSADLQPARTALVSLKSFDRNGGYKASGLKPYVGPYKSTQVVHPGEIVVAQTDLTQGAEVVGRAVRVPGDHSADTLVASLDLAIVRPTGGLPVAYLLGILAAEDFRQHCRSRTSGTTVLHLASDAIQTYLAPLVPAGAMAAYVRVAEALLGCKDALEREVIKLQSTRAALLPDLLSGRIRVLEEARV